MSTCTVRRTQAMWLVEKEVAQHLDQLAPNISLSFFLKWEAESATVPAQRKMASHLPAIANANTLTIGVMPLLENKDYTDLIGDVNINVQVLFLFHASGNENDSECSELLLGGAINR